MPKQSRLFFTFLTLLFFVLPSTRALATPPYVVMGYFQSFRNPPISSFPWNSVTHLVDAFAEPNSDGTINPSGRVGWITKAHASGVRFIVSFGGAGSPDTTWETALTSNESTLVNNIMTLMANGDGSVDGSGNPNIYDGVDIDWEFPHAADQAIFMKFLQDLAAALHATNGYDGKPRTLSMYTNAGGDYYHLGPSPICGVNWSQAATVLDFCNIGDYDQACPSGGVVFNGPLSVASGCNFTDCSSGPNARVQDGVNDVSRLAGLGFPINKMVLAFPMYGSHSGSTYDDDLVFQSGVSLNYYSPEDESTYLYGGVTLTMDASQAFCDKINWTLAQNPPLAGIGLWEVGYTLNFSSPEMTNVWNTIGGSTGCLVYPPTATPTVTFTPTNTFTPTPTPTPCFNSQGTPCATNTPTPNSFSNVTVPMVFPNPSDGTVIPKIVVPLSSPSDIEVKLFTLTLRKIADQTFSQVAPGTPISLAFTDAWGNSLSNGLYYLVVSTAEGTFTIKWLILR